MNRRDFMKGMALGAAGLLLPEPKKFWFLDKTMIKVPAVITWESIGVESEFVAHPIDRWILIPTPIGVGDNRHYFSDPWGPKENKMWYMSETVREWL